MANLHHLRRRHDLASLGNNAFLSCGEAGERGIGRRSRGCFSRSSTCYGREPCSDIPEEEVPAQLFSGLCIFTFLFNGFAQGITKSRRGSVGNDRWKQDSTIADVVCKSIRKLEGRDRVVRECARRIEDFDLRETVLQR